MNRNKLILGGVIIAVSLALGMLSFKKSLTPYVTFAEARTANRMVQVKGFPDHGAARFDPERKAFCFTMRDSLGEAMDVVYRGAKPGNFDQAEAVVAIGRFKSGVLESDQLLVKCPSKYESTGATEHPSNVSMDRGPRLESEPPAATPSPAATQEATR